MDELADGNKASREKLLSDAYDDNRETADYKEILHRKMREVESDKGQLLLAIIADTNLRARAIKALKAAEIPNTMIAEMLHIHERTIYKIWERRH